jgi:DNA-binding response OmpR family regulator
MRGRILVVDDEETVRLTLSAVLIGAGYDVTSVPTGADALSLLQLREFDVVLTDLRLDDLDGVQILARVQQRWPDTITLMLTGYASLDSAIAAMRAGAYDYLCKPCPVDEILSTVGRALERRRLALEVKRNVRHLEVSIDTARELHSALQSQVEGTRALLLERDRLLQSLGSEFKTSLLSITGMAELLLTRIQSTALDGAAIEHTTAEDVVRFVQQIRDETERLVEVVQDSLRPRTDEPEELRQLPSAAPIPAIAD